jgi:dihydrodipicolinate reductase
MKPLRVVVAGAGVIGRRHIELVLTDRDCDLAAIVERK